MATSDQTKQVNVRANVDLVDKIDRTLLQARAEGHLPMDYNRSDALTPHRSGYRRRGGS